MPWFHGRCTLSNPSYTNYTHVQFNIKQTEILNLLNHTLDVAWNLIVIHQIYLLLALNESLHICAIKTHSLTPTVSQLFGKKKSKTNV